MTARPSLTRSIPFWGLVAGSVASAAVGAWVVVDKTAHIEFALLNGTQTGIEIYTGQPLVVLGSVLVGAGIVGILLALAVAALSTLRPSAPVEIIEPYDEIDEVESEGLSETYAAADTAPDENPPITR